MAMMTSVCLENLVEIGKWMGKAHEYIELYTGEMGAVVAGEDLGQGRKFKALSDYNLHEMDAAAERMMENCPQMPAFSEPADDPRVQFAAHLENIYEHLANDNIIHALLQMRGLESTLMEWVNDIAFAGEPSRYATAGASRR